MMVDDVKIKWSECQQFYRETTIWQVYKHHIHTCPVNTDAGSVPRAPQVLPRLQGHAAARQREGARRQRRARQGRHQRRRAAEEASQLHAGPQHAQPAGAERG